MVLGRSAGCLLAVFCGCRLFDDADRPARARGSADSGRSATRAISAGHCCWYDDSEGRHLLRAGDRRGYLQYPSRDLARRQRGLFRPGADIVPSVGIEGAHGGRSSQQGRDIVGCADARLARLDRRAPAA